ncbi:MAG: methyltransferase domain-containing protein [Pseudonocardiaceae bacterium]
MTEPALLLRRMIKDLTASGELVPEWGEVFALVPRHVFIPEVVWWEDEDIEGPADLVPLRRADDPDAWLKLAYGPDFVITQVDDGDPVGPAGRGHYATSSASMPAVVADMLAKLDVQPGMRVLEIGAGTGYNAALLARRLGAENVTTIEIDPALATHARRALTQAGYGEVTVVTGDGALGHPSGAPYDRVISTVTANQVPYAWVEQTRPGGRVLTPWGTPYYNGGLLSLTVAGDGTAQGGLIAKTSFMGLRDQRTPRVSVRRCVHHEQDATTTSTDLHPHDVAGRYDVQIGIGIQVPQCIYLYQPDDDSGEATLWFLDPWSGSWASLHHHPHLASDRYRVRQLGPRHLFDEVETAYHWWHDAGSPKAEHWTFTITPEEQRICPRAEHSVGGTLRPGSVCGSAAGRVECRSGCGDGGEGGLGVDGEAGQAGVRERNIVG